MYIAYICIISEYNTYYVHCQKKVISKQINFSVRLDEVDGKV